MAKVLLVEDDNNLREIYEARLAAEGYEIVTAKDGEDALVVAKQHKPDLIISDVMMPRISGFEMLDILRNTDGLKHTKIVMLTALGQADDRTRADSLGADKYLVKSQVTLEDIVKTAAELLDPDYQPPQPETPQTEVPTTAPAASAPAPQQQQPTMATAQPPAPEQPATPAVAQQPMPAPAQVAVPPVDVPAVQPAPAPAQADPQPQLASPDAPAPAQVTPQPMQQPIATPQPDPVVAQPQPTPTVPMPADQTDPAGSPASAQDAATTPMPDVTTPDTTPAPAAELTLPTIPNAPIPDATAPQPVGYPAAVNTTEQPVTPAQETQNIAEPQSADSAISSSSSASQPTEDPTATPALDTPANEVLQQIPVVEQPDLSTQEPMPSPEPEAAPTIQMPQNLDESLAVDAQSTSQEVATVEQQIEEFVQNTMPDAGSPEAAPQEVPQPTPTAPSSEEQVSDVMPPTPQPTQPAPQSMPTDAADTGSNREALISSAMDNLRTDSQQNIASPDAPTNGMPAVTPEATRKKVIQPISSPEKQKDIAELAAEEEMRTQLASGTTGAAVVADVSSQPAPEPGVTPLPPQIATQPAQPGGVFTPNTDGSAEENAL